MSYSTNTHGIGQKIIHQCLSHNVTIVWWSFHQPHDHLSLAFCLLTNYRQSSAPHPSCWVTDLEPHSGAAINGELQGERLSHITRIPVIKLQRPPWHQEHPRVIFPLAVSGARGWRAGPWGQSTWGRALASRSSLKSRVWITARAESDDCNYAWFVSALTWLFLYQMWCTLFNFASNVSFWLSDRAINALRKPKCDYFSFKLQLIIFNIYLILYAIKFNE